MNASKSHDRRGLSLLEVMVALAILAMLMTPVITLLRTSHQVWSERQADHAKLEAGHATVRHLIRQLRQAKQIVSISPPIDRSGSISARLYDNRLLVWDHRRGQVLFGETSATSLLADGVEELWFVGLRADGVTPAVTPAEVRIIQCRAKVRLERDVNADRTISSTVLLRSF